MNEDQRRTEEIKLLAAIKTALPQLEHPDLEDSTVDHDTIVEDWRRNSESNGDDNYDFLRSLKFRNYGFDPDELAAEQPGYRSPPVSFAGFTFCSK